VRRSWCGTYVDGMKKSGEEAKKGQNKKIDEIEILCKEAGFEIQKGLQITPCA
jgi:hypothetical protein